jgi:hypothetical protein
MFALGTLYAEYEDVKDDSIWFFIFYPLSYPFLMIGLIVGDIYKFLKNLAIKEVRLRKGYKKLIKED